MKRIFDFKCTTCDKYSEYFIDERIITSPCRACSNPAHKVVSPVTFTLDKSFPGAADKWARTHEYRAKNPDSVHVHT